MFLGLIFTIFGLNGFLGFMSMPPMPEPASAFMMALAESEYFLPFLKSVELICGVALVANLFAPFALVVIAPVILNITLFHLFLAPEGLIIPGVLVVLAGFLGWSYRHHYKTMFERRATPVPQPTRGRHESKVIA